MLYIKPPVPEFKFIPVELSIAINPSASISIPPADAFISIAAASVP